MFVAGHGTGRRSAPVASKMHTVFCMVTRAGSLAQQSAAVMTGGLRTAVELSTRTAATSLTGWLQSRDSSEPVYEWPLSASIANSVPGGDGMLSRGHPGGRAADGCYLTPRTSFEPVPPVSTRRTASGCSSATNPAKSPPRAASSQASTISRCRARSGCPRALHPGPAAGRGLPAAEPRPRSLGRRRCTGQPGSGAVRGGQRRPGITSTIDGRLTAVLAFTVADGLIVEIDILADSQRLAAFDFAR